MVVLVLLAVCVALTFVGQTMPYPVLAPWLAAHHLPIGTLGWLSFAFSLGNFVGAPIAGGWVDRWGRRPMLIIGMLSIVITNLMIPFFDSFPVFVLLRFALGLGNAGVMPAALALTADIAPADARAKWVGIVTGGMAVGLIIGPTVGGGLFDAAGFAAPFVVSAGMGALAVVLVALLVPETRGAEPAAADAPMDIWAVFRDPPRPLAVLLLLLWVDVLWNFTWVATEPAMLGHLYGARAYTATMFGVVVGAFGVATTVTQLVAGGLSDRHGRLPIVALGTLLNVAWYLGVAEAPLYAWLIACAVVAGIGEGLVTPSLGAAYIDITVASQRGRVAALREMVVAVGGMAGPLGSIVLTSAVAPRLLLGVTAVILAATAGLVALGAIRFRRLV